MIQSTPSYENYTVFNTYHLVQLVRMDLSASQVQLVDVDRQVCLADMDRVRLASRFVRQLCHTSAHK